MSRLKKCTNEMMDEWLEDQGLYRKHTAKDGSCLFRAVSEQVFRSQAFHVDVRLSCIKYMERHQEMFESFIEGPYDHHLYNLHNPKEWAGQIEMLVMSLMYKKDFLVFQEIDKHPFAATDNGFDAKIMLCFSHGNHYDSIYSRTSISNAAKCQAIVYEMLYKNVFQMGDDVDVAVEKMLHDKNYAKHRRDSTASQESNWDKSSSPSPDFMMEPIDIDSSEWKENGEETSEIRRSLALGIPPFPYKVAKALDPDIYRNVEFDVWNEQRKAEVPQFEPGVKCLVRLDKDQNEAFHAHIQEIGGDNEPVTVFVEELGEKRIVPFEALESLPYSPQAHQWQMIGKSYKTLTGYYQKSPLDSQAGDYDKYKGKKNRLNKKKLKDPPIAFPLPLVRGHIVPPRFQSQQQPFESSPIPINYARGRSSPPAVNMTRSPSPRMKWTQPGSQPFQRFRQKNNSGGRYNHSNSVNSTGLSDIPNHQRKMHNGLQDFQATDLANFPALPKVQDYGRSSPSQPVHTVWSRHNGSHQPQHASSSTNGSNSQITPRNMEKNCPDGQDCTRKRHPSSGTDLAAATSLLPSRTPTSPVPIVQSSSTHPIEICSLSSPVYGNNAPSCSSSSSVSIPSPSPPFQPAIPSSDGASLSSSPPRSQHHLPLTPCTGFSSSLQPTKAEQDTSQVQQGSSQHSHQHQMLQQQNEPLPLMPMVGGLPPINQPPPPFGYIPYPPPPMYSAMISIPYDNLPQSINYSASNSQDPSGSDLPLSDLPTLRFFYNLGHECYRMGVYPVNPPPQYTIWNVAGPMAFSPINGFNPPMVCSDGGEMIEDMSGGGGNGQYPVTESEDSGVILDDGEGVGDDLLISTNFEEYAGVDGDTKNALRKHCVESNVSTRNNSYSVNAVAKDFKRGFVIQDNLSIAASPNVPCYSESLFTPSNCLLQVCVDSTSISPVAATPNASVPYQSAHVNNYPHRRHSSLHHRDAGIGNGGRSPHRSSHLPPRFQRQNSASGSNDLAWTGNGNQYQSSSNQHRNHYEGHPLLRVNSAGVNDPQADFNLQHQHAQSLDCYGSPSAASAPSSALDINGSSMMASPVYGQIPAYQNESIDNLLVMTSQQQTITSSPSSSSSPLFAYQPCSNTILSSPSSVGYYPTVSPSSSVSSPTVLASSPGAVYYSFPPYMYQPSPPVTQQGSFMPATAQ